MRERILGLPLMLAVRNALGSTQRNFKSRLCRAVLTLVWRQVPSARELNRMLARENLLWAKATRGHSPASRRRRRSARTRCVSQQALSQRLLTFPASMFERVLTELLVTLNQRWYQRKKRPLRLSVSHANQDFERMWIVDASTLEALFRKLKSLESGKLGELGGRICAIVDLKTRYPVQTWFHERPYPSSVTFRDRSLRRENYSDFSDLVFIIRKKSTNSFLNKGSRIFK